MILNLIKNISESSGLNKTTDMCLLSIWTTTYGSSYADGKSPNLCRALADGAVLDFKKLLEQEIEL